MKFTDVRTLESFLKEYGMNSGASTYGSNQSSITAPATGSKSPSTAPSASPTTKKAAQSPTTAGPAKKEVPQILAVRASDVPDDAVLKDIKNKPMGKVVSKVGDKPKADALVVDTGKSGKLQYQVLDKDQKVFIDNPEYKEESKATKLLSKLKIKNKKVRSIKTILRNGEDNEQNQTVNAGSGSMKESIFTQFDKLSLEKQLKILERVDTNKINEAWSKKYKDSINCSDPKGFSQKAHCAGKKETNEEKVRLDPKCWKGKKIGNPKTKMKGGVRVNNCVPAESIEEKRRNPEQNRRAGSGKYDLINWAEDNITDRENWAVSMTNVPKLGVNPRPAVSEDTPKGIYFYPLQYFMKMADRDEELPWGDNMPYMQLFQYDRSGEMTRETKVDPAKLKQAILPYCSEEIIQQAIDEPEYDGTPFWFIYDCLTRLEAYDETTIIRWNKILRVLGFTSVYDPGHGWIAHGEPTQGVILDPRIIKQHKMFDNRNPTMQHSRYDIQGLANSIGWSSYYQREKQSQRVQINHPDEEKVRLAVAKSMLRPFLGKSGEEAKAMGYDQALKAAADKVIEILKSSNESVAEGAVPDTSKVTTLNRLLAKPLLANELDAHIDALSALPIPTMMNDFRKARVMGGDDTDLRPILRGYIRDSLHPDLLKQINLNESVVTEAKGIMGRVAGDKFVKDDEQLEFQGVTVYPEDSQQFESPEQRNAAVAEFEKQTGASIEWTNAPNNGTLAFAVATLTDPLNNDAPTYWGRYFKAKMVDMMGSWGNAQVPAGWKLQKAGALKLDIGIDPQHLIRTENKHKSIDAVIATVAANSQGHQMQGELVGGLEQIKSGQNPVFENDIQHLPALRDYFGEIMGPCALMAGMVKGQAEDANQKLLQGAGWDKCQVFWPQSMNYALVDSIFIGPNGEEVGVSSKGGKGARASAKNIADAIKKADPKLVKKYDMTVAIIKIVDETPAIEAPFRIAELGKMLPAGLEREIKSYIKSGKTDYVGLSNDAKELFNYGTPRQDVPGFNTGYALLALLAKKVAYEVNLVPAFSAGCLAFLNQSSIVQLYCKMGKQGNNARVTGWDAVYPPNFQGRVVLDGSKNYYSSRIGGKFAFGFV